MKKILLWIIGILLFPIVLFALLAIAIYLPPVQDWAVKTVADYASEQTGMQISVGRVRLKFPLDLKIEEVAVRQEPDTLAHIGNVVADVELCPLRNLEVVVKKVELNDVQANTMSLISDCQVKGHVDRLSIEGGDISLRDSHVVIADALLDGADLTVMLSDTAATDTTKTATDWLIESHRMKIIRSRISLSMPGDTTHISGSVGELSVSDIVADLGRERYEVGRVSLSGSECAFNDIQLSALSLQADSIAYSAPRLTAQVRQAQLSEPKSGLQLTDLQTSVSLDDKQLTIPHLHLTTPSSRIDAQIAYPLNAFDEQSPGHIDATVDATVAKTDILKALAVAGIPTEGRNSVLPPALMRAIPESSLTLKSSLSGNMKRMEIKELEANLPSVVGLSAKGVIHHLDDPSLLKADLTMQSSLSNLSFAKALLPADIQKTVAIPRGMTLGGTVKANGASYAANLTATLPPYQKGNPRGTAKLNATFNSALMRYDGTLSLAKADIRNFLPNDSIGMATAELTFSGQGTDPMSSKTRLEADMQVYELEWGPYCLDALQAHASLLNGEAKAVVDGYNDIFEGTVEAKALISELTGNAKKPANSIAATLSTDITRLHLHRLGITQEPMTIALAGNFRGNTDLEESHSLNGRIGAISIADGKATYDFSDIDFDLITTPDTTWMTATAGDLTMKASIDGGTTHIANTFLALSDTIKAQYNRRHIDQAAIKSLLPTASLDITSGRSNPIVKLLKGYANTDFRSLSAHFTSSPTSGINGKTHLYGLNADSIRIDTVTLQLKDNGKRLSFSGQVRNNRRNPQFVFKTLFDGHVSEQGANFGIRYYDAKDELGLRIGAQATIEQEGMRFHLIPDEPLIGYKLFKLNKDNYILLDKDMRVEAHVDLVANDGTGVKIYSEKQDPDLQQDLTLSLNMFDLDKLTQVLPYVPRITGKLYGDYHIMLDQQKRLTMMGDMSIQNMTYEGSRLGNIGADLAYMLEEDDTHVLEARLMREGKEVGMLSGNYRSDDGGYLDGKLQLEHLPMDIINGFMPDQIMGFEGTADGTLSVKGRLSSPQVDGDVLFTDAYLVSTPYGVRLRFDDKPVSITRSELHLTNFALYAPNNNQLTVNGSLNFADTDNITTNLSLRAQNFLLIDSKQSQKSIAFGKAYVNFFALLSGTLDELSMRGRLDVLGSTDLTYLLLDSPLSTDNQMDELVRFTDFSDSTQTVVNRPAPSGLNVDMNISIDERAHFVCGLNAEQTNYVDILGGGTLRMLYTNDGMSLNGRLTLSDGQMKYSLPVIPLKTFTIQDGSYVEFTGDALNPRLNITATERTKASVSSDTGDSRSVQFDCGVVITKTLNDMGLEFIITAPEDAAMASELAAMATEERGKIAVTMLTTGMYLADGNTSNFTMNSALSSFLQSEINNITGNALKTLDLSVGLDNATDASGQMHTDYSFRFAKRFWNNRLKVQLGGKVSTGNDVAGQEQSFFDNVLMEYRLSPTANTYLSLFYNQNVYDWLEGYTGEYGAGLSWRRKFDSLKELIPINGKKN